MHFCLVGSRFLNGYRHYTDLVARKDAGTVDVEISLISKKCHIKTDSYVVQYALLQWS